MTLKFLLLVLLIVRTLHQPLTLDRVTDVPMVTSWPTMMMESPNAAAKTGVIRRARMWRGFRLRWLKPRHIGCIELDSTPLFTWILESKYTYEDDYECT